MIKFILKSLLAILIALPIITACTDDDEIENETFSSSNFEVLKISEGDNRLQDGEEGISAFELELEVVFTHPVAPNQLLNSLSVSGNAQYEATFDDSNSIATLSFQLLDYETEYTISLPAGTYGRGGESMAEDYSLSFTTRPFVVPAVTLSVENENPEEGTSTSIIATLSESTTADVEVNLLFEGSATETDDYVVGSKTITIPLGETSGSTTLEIEDDIIPEGAESIDVSIESLVNGQEADPQTLAISILDNDVFTDLQLKGVMAIDGWTGQPDGNSGKAVHLRATADIADLSVYGIGVANNGGGSDGIEYNFPAIAVAAGEDILLARIPDDLLAYFGDPMAAEFEHVFQSDAMNQNGDDAVELFSGTAVIQTYGDVIPDGTGEPWEYTGSWGYYFGDYWYYGGLDCAAGSTTTQDSDCTYPLYANALQLQGVMSFELESRDRAIHLRANRDIADLSIYGIGIPNNGGPSDGREMDLAAISVSEGDHILFMRGEDAATITTYLGNCYDSFDHAFTDTGSDINFNGDDPVELYENTTVIEYYGTIDQVTGEYQDGTGLSWEYTGSWAYKQFGDVYITGGVDCTAPGTTNATSSCPYAFCQ